MARIEKTVFISYRRADEPWALAVFENLTQHGYDVFIDYDGIASGNFETAILENIKARAHFLVLLTPTALERSSDPEDWMRREIEAALDSQRNIVPLMLAGFDFGTPATASQLTGKLAALKKYNGLPIPKGYFSPAMERLRNKFLNVSLDTVLHPASLSAQQAATEQKDKATMALGEAPHHPWLPEEGRTQEEDVAQQRAEQERRRQQPDKRRLDEAKAEKRQQDEERQTESTKTCDHLVVLVHGINTRALWMGDVKPALETAGFTVATTSYGRFSILPFLAPFGWLRDKAINRVATDIRAARRAYKIHKGNDPKRMSVISHSFGTYVVGRLLTDYPEFQWYRIIFCGSVVREDFPLDHCLERFSHPLLNEIGTKDFWPALAESAGWGYGSVGSHGLNLPHVETRWHHGYSHSDFLTEEFCNKFWTPFIQGDRPKPADKPEQMPLLVRLICNLPLRWAAVVFAGALVLFGAQTIARNAGKFSLSFSEKLDGVSPITRPETAVPTPPSATSAQLDQRPP